MQNKVGLEGGGGIYKRKNVKKERKEEKKKGERRKNKIRRDSLDLGGSDLSHFKGGFLKFKGVDT